MNLEFKEGLRPDEKGPRNIAVLLFLSSLLVASMGWQDWQLHHEGLSDGEIEVFLKTPNNQEGEPTTVEQYRDFEDEVRSQNGYLLRSLSLLASSGCLLMGSLLLYRLQRLGAQLCVTGAAIGLVGGVWGSVIINRSAAAFLGEALVLTYEIWVYLCGSLMGLCLAMAALPLLNAKAKLALKPRVALAQSEEE